MKVFTDGGFINFYIGTSRDGFSWDLSWVYANKPLIEGGPDGSFDQAGASPFAQPGTVTTKPFKWDNKTEIVEKELSKKPVFGTIK